MKPLPVFIAGLIVGFCVAFYIEVMSKPVEPSANVSEYPDWLEPAWDAASSVDYINFEKSLDDTQPVKVCQPSLDPDYQEHMRMED